MWWRFRLDAVLRSMRAAHGATMAKQAKTILRGALQLAVMANVLGANAVRDVQPLRAKRQPKGAVALTADELRALLRKLGASQFCRDHDLVDPITLLIATGLRRSELLALRRTDFDPDAGTLTVTGKLVRAPALGWGVSMRPRQLPVGAPCRCRASRWTCSARVGPSPTSANRR